MSTTKIHTPQSNATPHNAGRSFPHPSEAHRRAGAKGEKRSVVMNGSRLDLEHDGAQWWVVKVSPAPFVRSC